MRFMLRPNFGATTVRTSAREPIVVQPGGIIDTDDGPLVHRLQMDVKHFVPLTQEAAAPDAEAQPAPKKRGGRPKKAQPESVSAV